MTTATEPRWFTVTGTERDVNASIGDHAELAAAIEQATRQSIYVRRAIPITTDAGTRVGSARDGEWRERDGWREEHESSRSDDDCTASRRGSR